MFEAFFAFTVIGVFCGALGLIGILVEAIEHIPALSKAFAHLCEVMFR